VAKSIDERNERLNVQVLVGCHESIHHVSIPVTIYLTGLVSDLLEMTLLEERSLEMSPVVRGLA
jgi:hypothetical protein